MIRRARDLPLWRDGSGRFLPWIIGFMLYLTALALAAAIVFGGAVVRFGNGLSGTLTVQVMPQEGATSASLGDRVKAAARVLEQTPGVEGVRVLSAKEIARLLAPWLGGTGLDEDLPVPRLIDVTVSKDVRIDTEALRARLGEVAPGTIVDDHRKWLRDLIVLVRSVEWVAAGIVLATGLAAVLTVIFSARAGLAMHRNVVELLHMIGARDAYVARQFQYHAFGLGLRGGIIGLALAATTVYGFVWAIGPVESHLVPPFRFSPIQWAVFGALPFVAALIAMFTARVTILRALARMP